MRLSEKINGGLTFEFTKKLNENYSEFDYWVEEASEMASDGDSYNSIWDFIFGETGDADFTTDVLEAIEDKLSESEDSTKGKKARKTIEDQLDKNVEKKEKVGIEESEELLDKSDEYINNTISGLSEVIERWQQGIIDEKAKLDALENNEDKKFIEDWMNVAAEQMHKAEEELKAFSEERKRRGLPESEDLIIDDEKELAKYIAAHYEEITGVQLEDLFNKAEIEDSSEPIFNQSVVDETFDKIVNFIKDYNESNGTNYDSNDEDFLDLLDDELLKRREPMEESTDII